MIDITNVEVVLGHDPRVRPPDRPTVLAYCTLTLSDAFVVHNVKIIRTADGRVLVSMPSREVFVPCKNASCGANVKRSDVYCGQCGWTAAPVPLPSLGERDKRYYEIAHPITRDCRSYVTRVVLDAYDRIVVNLEGGEQRVAG